MDAWLRSAADQSLIQRSAQDESFDGRSILVDGRSMRSFGSCSYLGLELDPRLKAGAIDAIERYGTQLSSSRAYLSAPLYTELEALLGRVFDGHVIVAPTTTLAHQAALPTIVGEKDAVLLDHQVHASVQVAAGQLRAFGARVEVLRHGDMSQLDDRIEALSKTHEKVWYLADGVYSMYGDCAPMGAIHVLLDRHERLHAYIDDAHGIGWRGRHGRGVVLDRFPLHARMIVAASFAKCWGAGGGALVFPTPEQARRVRTCGGPFIFSGPLQPATLGACIASAHIHLSDELETLQEQLGERIRYCNEELAATGLPVASAQDTPIRFIACGLPRAAQALARRLLRAGFFVNLAHFPAVPMRRAGIRFTLTRHHERSDIDALVAALDTHYEAAFEDVGDSPEAVWDDFALSPTARVARWSAIAQTAAGAKAAAAVPEVLRAESIAAIDPAEWNLRLGGRGAFDASGLAFLERVFDRPDAPDQDWRFRYYRVRDVSGETCAETFFTFARWKADMLDDAALSRRVELRRREDPDFGVARVYTMGSLLSEGEHLWRAPGRSPDRVLAPLLEAVRADAVALGADAIALRDLPTDDPELDAFLRGAGFLALEVPESHVVDLDWADEQEYVARLGRRHRKHYRQEVAPWNDAYALEVVGKGGRRLGDAEHAHIRDLYLAVKRRNLEINTFDLPDDFFRAVEADPAWELLLWHARPPVAEAVDTREAVAVAACFVGPRHCVPTVIGLDYAYVESAGLYRQCLRHVVLRAKALGLERVELGFGAALEKRRAGARPVGRRMYMQVRDGYAFDAVEQLRTPCDD